MRERAARLGRAVALLVASGRDLAWRDLAAQLSVFRGTVRCGLRASHFGAIRDRRCWRLGQVESQSSRQAGSKRDVPSQVRRFHHIILQHDRQCSACGCASHGAITG
jgi:hypothetical protein